MAANLQSVLGHEVILPHDLLPDDTTLIYDKKGKPIRERDFGDPDDEELADARDHDRYKALALAYYNAKHHTDYKFVQTIHVEGSYGDSVLIHFGFTAKECDSAAAEAKPFCAQLEAPSRTEGQEVVTSCRIVTGPKTCEDCYISNCNWNKGFHCQEPEPEPEEVDPPVDVPDQYSPLLADGVTSSPKAKFRLDKVLLALAHYNKKQHKDYKLVDALPRCYSCDTSFGVYHANFIAKQNESGASNKLFFAELQSGANKYKCEWVVTACRIVRGKTTAGCHVCPRHLGKRVIHPTHGFRFGLYPPVYRSIRQSTP